jgi:ATP-dependent 26S proteasome regulatory subunit
LDLNNLYLLLGLGRIDIRLRRAVVLWQRAGQSLEDTFRGLYVADNEVTGLLKRPISANWGDTVSLTAEEEDFFRREELEAGQRAEEVRAEAASRGIPLRLEQLKKFFDLDESSLDAFLICLAPALDLRYEKVYGYLQDDVSRKRPTVGLVLDLLSDPGPERLAFQTRFGGDSPLFKYRLLEAIPDNRSVGQPLLAQILKIDPAIVSWLCGRYQPPEELEGRAVLDYPTVTEADLLLAGEMADRAMVCWDQSAADGGALWSFFGPDEESRNATARLVAARARRPLLAVDLGHKSPPDGPADPLPLRLALRDARLTGAVLYLTGGDRYFREESVETGLLAELFAHPGAAIVAGDQPWQPRGIDRDKRLFAIPFPHPPREQRVRLWRFFLEDEPFEADALSDLAGQFQLTSGQIRDAVLAARDQATQDGRLVRVDDLFAAARARSSQKLSTLSVKVIPRYDWADIVLPDDQLALLRELVDTVLLRPRVLDEWGVGRKLVASRGVTALFSGPPGTGKTMAAEVIAGRLGLDLYKIDLSSIVSKYIGETEKNLERIFTEAASSNAILFFDEADALFGKRSEVRDSHDRYANIEISYLLQRMETYDGVTILATNLRANLDEAFARRLNFAVDFPFPEENYRRRIWRTLFPEAVPHEAGLDFDLLARRYRLSGGNIRNILVSAAYLAAADGQVITMTHLLRGARRELQKMGRLVSEEELSIG